MAIEEGTPVMIRRDPYGASYLGWSLEGRRGTVTRSAGVGRGAVYYVRVDGEGDLTLPFRWVHLEESGQA